ncbi:MAG TPA: hypothetical protein PLY87_16855 [Planctomycetaceae bacterium]|nr:hypothetical protein [Planctomycetaceae bacterium]
MWRILVAGFTFSLLTMSTTGCALVHTDPDQNLHNEQPPEMGMRRLSQIEAHFADADQDFDNEPPPKLDMRELNQIEAHFFHEGVAMGELDPQQLQPGQHVEILSGSTPKDSGDPILIHKTIMAGTVKEVVGDQIVLSDVVLVNEARKQQGVPIVNKVPYFSRRFKNTGIARSGTHIPGEVTIEKSKILEAHELTKEALASLSGTGGYERIGVDFDFPNTNDEPVH